MMQWNPSTSAKRTKPGTMSLTWIEVRSDEEEREVRERGLRVVAQQMAQMPGFLAGLAPSFSMFTATAWQDPGSAAQLLLSGLHKDAVDRVLGADFGTAVFTSVWVPHHLNAMWVRCAACGRMADVEQRDG